MPETPAPNVEQKQSDALPTTSGVPASSNASDTPLGGFPEKIDALWEHPKLIVGLAIAFVMPMTLCYAFFGLIPGIATAAAGIFLAILPFLKPTPRVTAGCSFLICFAFALDMFLGAADRAKSEKKMQALVDSITGGNSYPLIVPQDASGLSLDGEDHADIIPLVIINKGDSLLTGITYSHYESSSLMGHYTNSLVAVPTIAPHGIVPLRTFLLPRLEGTNRCSYTFEIYTQAGYFSESIFLKRGMNGIYAHLLIVVRQANTVSGKGTDVFVQKVWSDGSVD